jgi:hypothetical protein
MVARSRKPASPAEDHEDGRDADPGATGRPGPAPTVERPRRVPRSPAGRLFLAWRVTLSRLLVAPFRSAKETVSRVHPVETLSAASEAVRQPEGLAALGPGARLRLRLLGIIALMAGAAALVYVEGLLGIPVERRLIDATWLLAWAPARLVVMRLTHPGSAREVSDAWGVGLLPLALSVAFPLDLVTLGASAWLTLRSLRALGDAPSTALNRVLFAFGGQAAAMGAAWLLTRGGLVFLLGGGF